MISVKLDREYYHLQADMEKWCTENLGPGMWGDLGKMPDCIWSIASNFGITFFTFRTEKQASMFLLRWW